MHRCVRFQKRQAQANTRSRSEMFNPSKEDSASGFRIEPPRQTPAIESSEESQRAYSTRTFHSGPLVNQDDQQKTARGKSGGLHVPGAANVPVVVSRASLRAGSGSRSIVTQAEAFAHGRRLSESINEHFNDSGRYDQAFQQKDERNGRRVDGATVSRHLKFELWKSSLSMPFCLNPCIFIQILAQSSAVIKSKISF
jgi:hypothetical protein